MAELADALGLGPSVLMDVEVRLLSLALFLKKFREEKNGEGGIRFALSCAKNNLMLKVVNFTNTFLNFAH